MDASADSWSLLSKIAANGRRLQASEEVAHWTLRIIIESHMRGAGFTPGALAELSSILGSEALQGILASLSDADAARIAAAIEPRRARRAASDPAWARKRLIDLVPIASGASPTIEDAQDDAADVVPPVVRVFSKHRSMGARRRDSGHRTMLSEHLLEES
jgi:hypothetical protein